MRCDLYLVTRVIWLYVRVAPRRETRFDVQRSTVCSLDLIHPVAHGIALSVLPVGSQPSHFLYTSMSPPQSPTISACSSLDSPHIGSVRLAGMHPSTRRRLSQSQTHALVTIFELKTHPSREERALLAAELGMCAYMLVSNGCYSVLTRPTAGS